MSPKGMNISRGQQRLVSCTDFFEEVVERHAEHLKDGFWGSIIKGAPKAPVEVEVEALRWLFKLPALADKSKAEEFVAGIPGEMVVGLMNASIWSRGIRFRDHLHTLLRSCASLTAGCDGKVCKHRLLIYLDAIHYVARASITPNGVAPSVDVLGDLRINFANMGFMRMLWTDSDPEIRVTSRSICALLARYFLRKNPLMDSDLAWLQDVVGKSSNTIFCSLDNFAMVDSMNIDSFVHGILSNDLDDLPNEQVFVETLVVLMNTGSQTALKRGVFKAELSAPLQRAEQDGHRLHTFLNK